MSFEEYRELNNTPEKRKAYLEKHYPGPSRTEIAAAKYEEDIIALGDMIEKHPIVGANRGGRVCGDIGDLSEEHGIPFPPMK